MKNLNKQLISVSQQKFDFDIEIIQSVYKLAKYLYECGNYTDSISYLYICLMVMQPSDPNYLNVLWGKLDAEILTLNWNTAHDDLNPPPGLH